MPQEIKIDGIGISPDVLTAIVSRAVSDVEGIASVGVKDLATNLVSMMLSSKAPASEPAVEAEVVGDKLALTVRVVAFFGYPFKKLAEAVRAAVVLPSMPRLALRLSVLTFASTASFSPRSNL